MKVDTYGSGGKTGTRGVLPAELFDGTVNEDALHQVVTAIRAHRRQGTASTKNRAAMTSGSRKPWRQKGTGRARAGTIRSPLWRGGAVVFGPQPRSYSPKVSKRLRQLAMQSALNARALDGDLALLEPVEFPEPKTRQLVRLLTSIGATDDNVLLMTAGYKPNVYLAARNLKRVKVLPWGEASAYDVLWADMVLVEADAFEEQVEDARKEMSPADDTATEITPDAALSEMDTGSQQADSRDDLEGDE
jgi:large subunit ribosomal protein L4